MQRSITLNVPQGVGDIFWIYQKMAPYFDVINFNIFVVTTDVVSVRAMKWLELFPKTGTVTTDCVTYGRYRSVIERKYSMAKILSSYEKGVRQFDYACNLNLEEGQSLFDIDPEYRIEEVVEIKTSPINLPYRKFITVYVSGGIKDLGGIREGCWSVEKWDEFLHNFLDTFAPNLPVIFIGASYDRDIIQALSRFMFSRSKVNIAYIDLPPENVCYILKLSKFFIGHQSGLSILADNLGTPQLMLYYNRLESMMYTWCIKNHINTKFFADVFQYKPSKVIQRLKDLELSIEGQL
jgi:hypothetical protein